MLRDLLGFSKEPIETEISEAAETFREHKESEMDKAKEKSEAIRTDVIQEFEELEDSLEELGEFEDEKDRQVINDVVDNIISDRLEMIDELEFPENPEKLHSELNRFITDFQSLKQKEAAVLEEAYLQKKISRTIGGLESQRERLGEFIDAEYSTVTNYEELEQLLEKRENLLDKIDSLEQETKQLEVEKLEKNIDEVEEQLSELEESSDWQEYEFLQDEVEKKRSEKRNLKSDLNTSLNKMERGLKKLIYQVENGDLSVENISLLEKLRNKDTGYLLEHPEKTVKVLRESEESLPEDLLNDKQQQKFLESIREVEKLPQITQKLESIKAEIDDLREQVENHSAPDTKKDLRTERRQLKKKLENERKEKQRLEDRLEDTETEVEETENRIKQVLEDSLHRETVIE